MKLNYLKHQRLDIYDDKEEKSLDKFESKNEEKDIKYIPFPFIASTFPP